ncbi:MAG: 16S rRNA (cytosine(967)-C(5))-methyltransferase RsmB [Lachnospiraceae bacterium]|nr:16S rRNA (cytosine(967)-C(5))-methyltransferase RsmB [Lachnospiraceae bacterium]
MDNRENVRELALDVLLETEKNNIFVKDALNKQLFAKQFLPKADRAFLSRLVEGVTEYQIKLDYIIDSYSKVKAKKCKPVIRTVLRMGIYQMLFMDGVPDQAACNEAVKLVRKRGLSSLSGFVNGVLRNIGRNKEDIPYPDKNKDKIKYYSVMYSVPEWIVKKYISWFGEDKAETVLKSYLTAPELTIRVNDGITDSEKLTDKLTEAGVDVASGHYTKDALILSGVNYVKRLPGFAEGEFFIQDESSMLLYTVSNAAKMCDEKDEPLHVLDLCAAPGGKCTHFAQKLADKAIIDARDISERKTDKIKENITRLKLSNIEVSVSDALVPDESRREWADIVIADLPCSGLGIIGKKNDIKYHVTKQKVLELVNLQRNILSNAAEYVKPGGILLYSTCTINPAENRDNADWFLSHFPFEGCDMRELVPDELKSVMENEYSLQLLPGICKCDGFYIAKFVKKS